ncbi:MAG: phosphoribosylanthranilate isomerase [Parvibaculales bacterium]
MAPRVKICGLTRADDIRLANELRVDMCGFVFFKASPRHLSDEQAAGLAGLCAPFVERVALLVDPDDDALDHAVGAISPHRIQLHGDESPARVAEIKRRTQRPIIKALGVAAARDLETAQAYEGVADWFLFDAKPTDDGLPGGNGEAFDWQLLDAYAGATPWLLAGGLTPDNVTRAVTTTRAPMVDVSSGVEAAPGEKDAELMRAFIDAAKQGPQA